MVSYYVERIFGFFKFFFLYFKKEEYELFEYIDNVSVFCFILVFCLILKFFFVNKDYC